jgi:hypothetical protein
MKNKTIDLVVSFSSLSLSLSLTLTHTHTLSHCVSFFVEAQQEEQRLAESKKEHCHWESNLIFIGYKNIDFDLENQENELRGLKEALEVINRL